jgi:uncharacterized RDD family membrane protein YckC
MSARFCGQCGSPVGPGERFCRVCGTDLGGSGQDSPYQSTLSEVYAPAGSPVVGPVAQRVEYAGFWLRVVAALIDGVFLSVINRLAILPVGKTFETTTNARGEITDFSFHAGAFVLALAIGLLISGTYETVAIARYGRTIGKLVMGLRVVNRDGRLLSPGAALGRWAGKYVSAMILFLGYLMVAWDPRKQALHDKMAGSFVIRRRDVYLPAPLMPPGNWR